MAIFSEDGAPGMKIEPSIALGSYGTQRIATKLSGDTGSLNYVADLARFSTDGYRDHSAAKRDNLNAKLRWTLDNGARLSFVANAVDMPDIQDPLGLTRAQYEANPRQATQAAYDYNTRKNAAQQQLGANLEQKLGAGDTVNLMVYGGHRASTQYQAIPSTSQAVASSPGGLIDLKRDYWGIDARWTHRGQLVGTPLTLTGGLSYDNLDEARKGFQNFLGPAATPTATGVVGAMRRNESNRIHNFDQYLQAQWEPAAAWLLMAGVRHSTVKVGSEDHYVVTGNGNDSGSLEFAATTPVLGVTWRLSPAVNLYASAGKGFETPTMNELSYQRTGAGLNLALHPAKSNNLELGIKALVGQGTRLSAAAFDIRTQNEIVTDSNVGGRATFQNVDGTKRTGFELALDSDLGNNLNLALAYTKLKAIYSKDFTSCRVAGCPTFQPAVFIPAGNRMPGVPASTFYGELSWNHPASGFNAAVEIRHAAKVYVDDENSDAAPAYTIGNLRFGFEQAAAGWTVKEFLRIDNLSDVKYAGSVIVNDGNARYFESAPGRNYLLGVSASYRF
jgi:iron complex outermembrane receptor protein